MRIFQLALPVVVVFLVPDAASAQSFPAEGLNCARQSFNEWICSDILHGRPGLSTFFAPFSWKLNPRIGQIYPPADLV